jgi:polyhydroxyalkanoate synthesis regulator phasin
MGEHMQMMADRMKEGQMTPDQTKTMKDNMMKCCMKGM